VHINADNVRSLDELAYLGGQINRLINLIRFVALASCCVGIRATGHVLPGSFLTVNVNNIPIVIGGLKNEGCDRRGISGQAKCFPEIVGVSAIIGERGSQICFPESEQPVS
jgi:hypothetical protein